MQYCDLQSKEGLICLHASICYNPHVDLPLKGKKYACSFCFRALSTVKRPSRALFRQLTGLTVESQSYSTVQLGRHRHIEPHCAVIVFVNSTYNSILDIMFGHSPSIRIVESSIGSFDPSTEWRVARKFDCWRCDGRGSVKGNAHGAVEIGERV